MAHAVFLWEVHREATVGADIQLQPVVVTTTDVSEVVRDGDESPLGLKWKDPMAVQVLEAAAEAIGYEDRSPTTEDGRLRGIGFSVCNRNTGGGNATARVTMQSNRCFG